MLGSILGCTLLIVVAGILSWILSTDKEEEDKEEGGRHGKPDH